MGAIATKDYIRSTFLSMCQKTPLYKVSISELCDRTEISRTTFYRYYDSIYDLAEELEEEHLEGFMEIARQHAVKNNSIEEYMRDIISYISEEESFFKWVLSEHSDRHFVNRWKRIIRADIIKEYHLDQKKLSGSDEVLIEMLISGAIGVYAYWLFHNSDLFAEQIIPLTVKMWDLNQM